MKDIEFLKLCIPSSGSLMENQKHGSQNSDSPYDIYEDLLVGKGK